ncbi:hypothetical protein [Janibacter melonis]|uniref:hypothetical protein n=1 Tax=Janibacter melonis TaxID=262209 RepID=UPI00174E67FF|nr:hypothetical protein [Janibacter melonis]
MSTGMTTALYDTGSDAIRDLLGIIEYSVNNDARTLQTDLGPSELGVGCDRCLVHLLAGHLKRENGLPWLPTIGNAVHDWLEVAVLQHLMRTGSDRYLPEGKVAVGQLRGRDVTGHSDVFDTHTGTVVDWKIVGATTLKKVRAGGASITYRRQAHMYGRGWAAAGYDVREVAIAFLPRNAMTLRDGKAWTEPYDEQVALDALARANALAAGVDTFGADAVLAACPPHTGLEFTCAVWPSDPAPTTDAAIARQTAGLIPA